MHAGCCLVIGGGAPGGVDRLIRNARRHGFFCGGGSIGRSFITLVHPLGR